MKKTKKFIAPIIIVALFLLVGLIIFYFLNQRIKKSFFTEIDKSSSISIAAVNPERVRNLAAIIPEDITSSVDYFRLRDQITRLGKAFSENGIDAIYLLAKKGNEIHFIVESTPEGEPDAVIPGVLYEKPPQEIFNVFAHGVAIDTSVYNDEYGQYLSQFSPIMDVNTGELVGVLGVDVNYSYFQKIYNQQVFIFVIVWSTICFLFVFLYLYFRGIYRLNSDNRISSEKINSISNSINDGVLVIDNNSLISFWNKTSEKMFHCGKDKFLKAKFSDIASIEDAFDLKLEKKIPDFSFSFSNNLSGKVFELKMSIPGEPSNYYEASFMIAEIGEENYLVGVFHNISKRKKIELELKDQKQDLEKINNLMVGRELKMMDLKEEINRLKNKK